MLEISVVQAIRQLGLDEEIKLTDNVSEADALLALHSKLKNSRIQAAAKSHDMPIYVTKTSSLLQITKAIRALVAEHGKAFQHVQVEDSTSSLEKADALEEARLAIEQVVIPKGKPVELLPRSPHVISAQMDFIQRYNLKSEKVGEEPNFHLRILPMHTEVTSSELEVTSPGFEELASPDSIDSSYNGSFRLPLLPD